MKPLDENEYELIERFLKGVLTQDETADFEHRLKTDPLFSREVDWMKDLRSLQENKKEIEVLQKFNEIHNKGKQSFGKYIWGVALSIIAISGLFFLLNKDVLKEPQTEASPNPKNTVQPSPINDTIKDQKKIIPIPEKDQAPTKIKKDQNPPEEKPTSSPPVAHNNRPSLSWEHYIEFEDGLQTLGDEEDAALDSALTLVDLDEKVKALPFFEKYFAGLTPEEEDFEMRLVAGKIYLKYLKKWPEAIRHLQVVKDSDAIPVFKVEADFFLAIIDLENNNIDKAKVALELIAKQNYEPWNVKAKELLESLK